MCTYMYSDINTVYIYNDTVHAYIVSLGTVHLIVSLCTLYVLCIYTVVWEKLVVGNIQEKKFRGKKFRLSTLQTIIDYSISLW